MKIIYDFTGGISQKEFTGLGCSYTLMEALAFVMPHFEYLCMLGEPYAFRIKGHGYLDIIGSTKLNELSNNEDEVFYLEFDDENF